MSKRQYVQLAHVFVKGKHGLAGRYASEKLDGQRAIWDGGVSRGILKSKVPYANTARDERFVRVEVATGLWSRYGNVIHAPSWFLDQLPPFPADMELYAGRKNFQSVQSTVRDIVPGQGWRKIEGVILDSPPIARFLAIGKIDERNIKLTIGKYALDWWNQHCPGVVSVPTDATYEQRLSFLKGRLKPKDNIRLHQQIELPFSTAKAEEAVQELMLKITQEGGEGVIIKTRSGHYMCERSHDVLKLKMEEDSEGTVVGYTWGDLPDNTRSVGGEATGKYLGVMGSLILEWHGSRFKLSGFTDEERKMSFKINGECAADVGILNPGKDATDDIENKSFPRGSLVTFKYRELTDDGRPKEARYLRKRNER